MNRSCNLLILVLLFLVFLIPISKANLVVDHNSVENFNEIPEYYIRQVYGTKFHHSGRSHSRQINEGLKILEANNPSLYNIGIKEYNAGFDTDYQWSDENRALKITWRHSYPADYPTYVSVLSDADYSMFTWCSEANGDDWEQVYNDYISRMNNLESQYPEITFIYVTGNSEASCYGGGLNRHRFNERLREYCENNNKILFDFADIEAWYNGDKKTIDCDSTEILYRHDSYHYDDGCGGSENCGPGCRVTHTNNGGCTAQGKAFWWLMARLAGWNPSGSTTTISLTSTTSTSTSTSTSTVTTTSTRIISTVSGDQLPKWFNLRHNPVTVLVGQAVNILVDWWDDQEIQQVIISENSTGEWIDYVVHG